MGRPYVSARARRLQRERRAGLAILSAVALAVAAMLCGAAYLDSARGISLGQSLRSAGL